MCQRISLLLRGKHRVDYKKNELVKDEQVIIVNAGNIYVTGKQMQKIYRSHSGKKILFDSSLGYSGGLKEVPLRDLMKKNPTKLVFYI